MRGKHLPVFTAVNNAFLWTQIIWKIVLWEKCMTQVALNMRMCHITRIKQKHILTLLALSCALMDVRAV